MNPEINDAVAEEMATAPAVEVVIPTEEIIITQEILDTNPGLEEEVSIGDVVIIDSPDAEDVEA